MQNRDPHENRVPPTDALISASSTTTRTIGTPFILTPYPPGTSPPVHQVLLPGTRAYNYEAVRHAVLNYPHEFPNLSPNEYPSWYNIARRALGLDYPNHNPPTYNLYGYSPQFRPSYPPPPRRITFDDLTMEIIRECERFREQQQNRQYEIAMMAMRTETQPNSLVSPNQVVPNSPISPTVEQWFQENRTRWRQPDGENSNPPVHTFHGNIPVFQPNVPPPPLHVTISDLPAGSLTESRNYSDWHRRQSGSSEVAITQEESNISGESPSVQQDTFVEVEVEAEGGDKFAEVPSDWCIPENTKLTSDQDRPETEQQVADDGQEDAHFDDAPEVSDFAGFNVEKQVSEETVGKESAQSGAMLSSEEQQFQPNPESNIDIEKITKCSANQIAEMMDDLQILPTDKKTEKEPKEEVAHVRREKTKKGSNPTKPQKPARLESENKPPKKVRPALKEVKFSPRFLSELEEARKKITFSDRFLTLVMKMTALKASARKPSTSQKSSDTTELELQVKIALHPDDSAAPDNALPPKINKHRARREKKKAADEKDDLALEEAAAYNIDVTANLRMTSAIEQYLRWRGVRRENVQIPEGDGFSLIEHLLENAHIFENLFDQFSKECITLKDQYIQKMMDEVESFDNDTKKFDLRRFFSLLLTRKDQTVVTDLVALREIYNTHDDSAEWLSVFYFLLITTK